LWRKGVRVSGDTVEIRVPVRLSSPANGQHGHWSTVAREAREQRTITRWAIAGHCLTRGDLPPLPVAVEIVRCIGPRGRELDTDNLAASGKRVRDEIAAAYGCGDGPRDPIVWTYSQERSPDWGCLIRIRSTATP
jgi:hypothetical protein